MQKTSHRRADRSASGFWLSTARRAIESARLTGRLFSGKDGEARPAREAIAESVDEAFEDTPRADGQSEPDAFLDLPAASRNVARRPSTIGNSGRRCSDRVVLFVPGAVTEADLLRENLARGEAIRRHRRRRKRFRWLADNAGTIVFVIGLFVLVWFVGAG